MVKVIVGLLLVVFSGQLWADSDQYPLGERSIFSERAIKERLKAEGTVCMEGEECVGRKPGDDGSSGGDASAAATPESTYQTTCASCHGTGAAGAPKVGDSAEWNKRLEKGFDQVVAIAIKGQGAMPPKGMCMNCSDDDLKDIVQYMLDESGVGSAKKAGSQDAAAKEEVKQEVKAEASAVPAIDGEKIYTQRCSVCHGQGIAGAPKVGDASGWESRISKGFDTLVQNAIKGFNTMPPRGTCMDCDDAMIEAAVKYMVDSSK